MRKTVVFGAGVQGEKFIYRNFDRVNIYCFWDNKKTGEFLGYPIKKPEFDKNLFVVVASTAYLEIREQLISMGYQEFEDFIPFQIFEKKMVVAFGNCHLNVVRQYLEGHKGFSSEYGFYPFPTIDTIEKHHLEYSGILEQCDLFFHQSIRKDNRYGEEYSSEYMLQYVRNSCKVISVPNLYGLPKYLFPQSYEPPQMGVLSRFFLDRNVIIWLKEGKSEEEIIAYILRGGIYSKSEIRYLWEAFKKKMCDREKEWDIKISDYILDNYKRDKIFADIGHINSKTAKEIASRILEFMKYKEKLSVELPLLDGLETVVYQDVKEALGLEFEEELLRKYVRSRSLDNYEMNVEEYVRQLCRYTKFWMKSGVVE